jgi:hypothetical protein
LGAITAQFSLNLPSLCFPATGTIPGIGKFPLIETLNGIDRCQEITMSFWETVLQCGEVYERGRAIGVVTRLLSKNGTEAIAEIAVVVSTSSSDHLDRVEGVLMHSCEHAWTARARQHAAETLESFRRMRG